MEGRLGNEEWKGELFRKPVIRILSFNSKSILYTLLCGPRTGNLQTSALLGPLAIWGVQGDCEARVRKDLLLPVPHMDIALVMLPDCFLFLITSCP